MRHRTSIDVPVSAIAPAIADHLAEPDVIDDIRDRLNGHDIDDQTIHDVLEAVQAELRYPE